MADFVHLHNHSEFSLLDGLSRVKDIVSRAKELGMKAIAVTDHGNMYAAIKFYKEALLQGIKPIIGCEIYVAKRSLRDRDSAIDKDYNHLILLAKNENGYKNLMKIVSVAHLEGFYYKPRTDIELLKKYREGLVCLTACVNGYVSEPLLANQEEQAEKRVTVLSEIYGQENVFLELQRHQNVPRQEELDTKLIAISRKFGIPVVATNDNHYVYRNDAEAQEILLCIQTQTTIETPNRKLSMIESPDFYIKSKEEMQNLFSDIPEAIENSSKIADACNVEITMGKWIMPNFDVPEGKTASDYLKENVQTGLLERYARITPEIRERSEYELSTILKKGYETYILIVADFVNWAKNHGITVGPGRGSNAGSIISYALRISDVDPLYFKLPFERFLNPMRPSPPDIDLDFADDKRDLVIEYVTEKYGVDKVAQIITYGTMEARGAVRDVGRALGMPYAGPDRIAKMIPPGWQGHAMTIDKALEQSTDLRRAYSTEKETKRLLDVARKLEGVARHASVHAAGVVIADKPLTEYTPIQKETNGDKIVTQYDMYTVGEDGVGLLKIDFLGLRNLTIIQEALFFIQQNREKDIDFSHISFDDKATYDMLSSGETTGIFQLESAGMRRYIKELKPSSIFDLQAMVALYRPGPMANIPEFIRRKHNPKLITYPDPRLESVLKESYGIITYQDDLLLTAINVAGYSWLEADKLRKAVGKKIPAEMKKQHDKFIQGSVANGLERENAENLWSQFEPFAGYGFGKAHAACYATIAFRTAYLKTHYPVEFMTALLTAESRGTTGPTKNEKISQAVAECKRLKIKVLPPSANYSDSDFKIEEQAKIRFGLNAIKNVGEAAISSILRARIEEKFGSFTDFIKRVDLSKVNKKTLESLIKAGAMDEFGNRASLLSSMQTIIERVNKEQKTKRKQQTDLFGLFDQETASHPEDESKELLSSVIDFSEQEKLMFEKELLGFFLTSHPLSQYSDRMSMLISHPISELKEEQVSIKVRVGGLISHIKKIYTKKGNNEMAFVTVEDHVGASVECVVFPKVFETSKQFLTKDAIIIIEGKLEFKEDQPVIIVDLAKRLSN